MGRSVTVNLCLAIASLVNVFLCIFVDLTTKMHLKTR